MRILNNFPDCLRRALLALTAVCLLIAEQSFPARAQKLDGIDRDRGHTMLKVIKKSIEKDYYDPNFHGMDLDARFKAADEKIDQATSLGQVFGIVAQALLDLDDSHTFFIPPSRTIRVDYGWQMQMIGDKCYVVAVKPGSDAEAKGLKPGDLLLSIEGYTPARENMWKMTYLYYTLRPQPGLRVVAQSPGGQPRELDLPAKVQQSKRTLDLTGSDGGADIGRLIREGEDEDRLNRHRYYELGDDLFIWKMPHFDLSEQQVDDMMSKIRKRKALILDLRGNSGGYETTLLRLLGHFFSTDVKIGDIKRRKETKPLMVKSRGKDAFEGNVVVLVDSKSASASELFARVMQIEKRAKVLGDRTSGAVMRSMGHTFQMGVNTVVLYGASITDADIVMTDGKSLEREGVTPDEVLLPSGADMASNRDPVISRAAELVGMKIEPEKAGAFFPIEWRR